LVSAITILRSVITRCDAIVKAPSNDPLTAVALARTLADVAPTTRSPSTSRWPTGKAGDEVVEEALYRPEHIEKIVAWGGLASVKHVTRYIQPGLELIALDPEAQRDDHRSGGFRRRCHDTGGREAGRQPMWVWLTRKAAPTPASSTS